MTQAIEKQVQDWDEYTGRLAPMGSVGVRPRVSGYITEVQFVDGDLVKKGQPLFTIDPRPYQADYNQAKAEVDKADAALKLASADFERARQLRDKGVTAAGDFDQRSATYSQATGAAQSARATLEHAKLNLEFCTITAPIDGRASLANVTVGRSGLCGRKGSADHDRVDKSRLCVCRRRRAVAFALRAVLSRQKEGTRGRRGS